ncbi:aspartic proteinase-like protein 1 isoform X1 [Cinnamomum micranthum f. kanehirae]|uniref:Aspartic proteinase-like protein 1 isoform X1 n=1 Tax=Cinnamomum micranthum f. kanehirae TaxID=337451 RepID=A0A443NIS7_9MAGN|nr:aspartic proteinase-like protein 1 isoform X1 [Cinnamomum micranthum f. kanehirae]
MSTRFFISSLFFLLMSLLLVENARSLTFSLRLIHRFSDEAKALAFSRNGGISQAWPRRRSLEYYQMLVHRDVKRQKMKIDSKYPSLFPLKGSEIVSLGDDFGWLHYTWLDIGTPNVSFLVALDTGSDLFWVPCDCIHCAPLSAGYYSLDRDLSMYSPSESRTSKPLSCSHELCALGSNCKSPNQHCPYIVNYSSENTSSSGLLVEDTLYLTSRNKHASRDTVQTPVIIGCGRMQTGGLDGIAPDGLLGLGFGDISIPSFLAKAGLVQNSFSICFDEDDTGRIFIGDQGISTQLSTPFLTWEGKYVHYIVGVDRLCVGVTCLKQTGFQALVDSGSSFTFLPAHVYEIVTVEFDRQMNASRISPDDSPWEYCYKPSSLGLPEVPAVSLIFAGNNSYVVHNPIYSYYGKEEELVAFCLAIESAANDVGTIGQNLMLGYRLVFDRENLKLGWSNSSRDINEGTRAPLTPPPHNALENQLPTNEQQNSHGSNAVSPAVAGRTPPDHAAASKTAISCNTWFTI